MSSEPPAPPALPEGAAHAAFAALLLEAGACNQFHRSPSVYPAAVLSLASEPSAGRLHCIPFQRLSLFALVPAVFVSQPAVPGGTYPGLKASQLFISATCC